MSELRDLMTNRCVDPNCLKVPSQSWGVTVVGRDEDGHRIYHPTYTSNEGVLCGTLRPYSGSMQPGDWIVTVMRMSMPQHADSVKYHAAFGQDSQVRILKDDILLIAGRIKLDANPPDATELWIYEDTTILHAMILSDDDWQHLWQLYQQGKLPWPWWGTPPDATPGSPLPPILYP